MENKTGTYRYDHKTGQVVKVSDRIPVLNTVQDWKREMNPVDELRRGYQSLEEQGKLGEADDAEVQAEAL